MATVLRLEQEQGGRCYYCQAQLAPATLCGGSVEWKGHTLARAHQERHGVRYFDDAKQKWLWTRGLMPTVDHKTPRCRGGGGDRSDPANLVLACKKCNGRKADMTEEEYRCNVLAPAMSTQSK